MDVAVSWYVKTRGLDGDIESIFCTSPEGVIANILHLSTLGREVWIEDPHGAVLQVEEFLPQQEARPA